MCYTREQGSSNAAAAVNANGNRPAPNETFQQLRQAVLSSLDFSDNAEQTQDWGDDGGFESLDDIPIEPEGKAATVGKAVYEASTLKMNHPGVFIWHPLLQIKTRCEHLVPCLLLILLNCFPSADAAH